MERRYSTSGVLVYCLRGGAFTTERPQMKNVLELSKIVGIDGRIEHTDFEWKPKNTQIYTTQICGHMTHKKKSMSKLKIRVYRFY